VKLKSLSLAAFLSELRGDKKPTLVAIDTTLSLWGKVVERSAIDPPLTDGS
jgi:hypothetical protein